MKNMFEQNISDNYQKMPKDEEFGSFEYEFEGGNDPNSDNEEKVKCCCCGCYEQSWS